MDQKIRNHEIINLSDFISIIKEQSSDCIIPEEKLLEIKKLTDNKPLDYHSLQSIIDLIFSVPDIVQNEKITNFFKQYNF